MKVKLYRSNFNKTGVIGEMECGDHVFTTLEHAYDDHGHIFTKLTDGEYICKKGIHRFFFRLLLAICSPLSSVRKGMY